MSPGIPPRSKGSMDDRSTVRTSGSGCTRSWVCGCAARTMQVVVCCVHPMLRPPGGDCGENSSWKLGSTACCKLTDDSFGWGGGIDLEEERRLNVWPRPMPRWVWWWYKYECLDSLTTCRSCHPELGNLFECWRCARGAAWILDCCPPG
jgi:hypothetical protein